MKKFIKQNFNYLNSIFLSLKNEKAPIYLKRLQRLFEEDIFTSRKIKKYLSTFYSYPEKNYERTNKPVESASLGDKVALVLSGGGARGASHIGVLKVLEDRGISPAFIVGTSAGAVIGSAYSAGIPADKIMGIFEKEEDMFLKLSHYLYFSQKTLSNTLRSVLKTHLSLNRLENTEIPFYINATDINKCERIIFSEGNLIELILASSAVPFFFEPIICDNYVLIDGGVMDNFCVDVARVINKNNYSNDLKIIVSDVSAATDITSPLNRTNSFLNLSKEFFEAFKFIGKEILPVRGQKDIFSIINNLVFILSKRGELAPTLSDDECMITPLLEKMGVFEFKKCKWAYDKGVESANKVLQ